MTYGKVAHLRHGRFRHADFTAEFLDFFGKFSDGIHADVVGNRLLRLFTGHQCAIWRIVGAASIDVPVIASPGKWIDLPAKQIAVTRPGAFRIVSRDFKPTDACSLFLL